MFRLITQRIKILYFYILVFVACSSPGWASNVKIDKQPVIVANDTVAKTAVIQFDMSWDNSWCNLTNHDAVWIVAKYKQTGNDYWMHVKLSEGNNVFSVGTENNIPMEFTTGTTNKKVTGVFAFRKNTGSGNVKWNSVKLKWNYGENGLKSLEDISIKVFAFEMVYVPQGAFKIGSGGTESSAFFTYPDLSKPFSVTSESAITSGTSAGNLCYAKVHYAEPYYGEIPAAFPKGYHAFYCMKYELTQGQYVDFLNTLSRKQQLTRVFSDINGVNLAKSYVMSNSATLLWRNGIRCKISFTENEALVFYCDLNGNNIPNEKNDGQNISCNYLSWTDDGAFSDWAALRPMTELEFEKACRGTSEPLPNEYCWGNTNIIALTDLTNIGTLTEAPLNLTANCCFDNPANINGPVRTGCFENIKNSREQNGSSFYGIFDLAGNLFERCITVANEKGVSFKGTHGDGDIDAWGYHDISDWPQFNAIGSGFRGGSFFYGSVYCRTSDRQYAALGDYQRYNHYGYRAVRTAE